MKNSSNNDESVKILSSKRIKEDSNLDISFNNLMKRIYIILLAIIISIIASLINENYQNKKKFNALISILEKEFTNMEKKGIKYNGILMSKSMLNKEKTKLIFKRMIEIKKDKINIKNPKTYTEKINWIIVFDNIPKKTELTDKLLVCHYTKEKVGIDLCVPKYKEYDKLEDINFDELPNEFVLKTNHASGSKYMEIVNNKSIISKEKIIDKFKEAIKVNYAYCRLEPHYYEIKPRIYAEKLLDIKKDPKDYKIWCINGIPEFYTIVTDRSKESYHANWYDKNNKFIDMSLRIDKVRPDLIDEIPENINLMMEYTEKICKAFKHVRVDLYNVNGTIYLGEMTFTSHSGQEPFKKQSDEIKVGELMNLNYRTDEIKDYNPEYLIKLEETDLKVPISNFI